MLHTSANNDLLFLPKRMKVEKINKKNKFEISMKSWISFQKNIHIIINFNQKAWRKSYLNVNTYLRKATKKHF